MWSAVLVKCDTKCQAFFRNKFFNPPPSGRRADLWRPRNQQKETKTTKVENLRLNFLGYSL